MRYVGIDLSLTATAVAWTTVDPFVTDIPTVELIGTPGLTNRADLIGQASRLRDQAAEIAIAATLRDGDCVICIELPPPMHGRAGTGESERGYLFHEVCYLIGRACGFSSTARLVGVNLSTLKKFATGKGNANKNEVVDAVARRWPDIPTRGNDNKADAGVLMVIASYLDGSPYGAPIPKVNRSALDTLAFAGAS